MCVFTLLYYQGGVSAETSCGEERNVGGVEGGEVTLHVDHTGFRTITWVTLKNVDVIATTEPGKVIKDITHHYKGRLTATSNGSLVITNLTREDQGLYKANILRSSQCIQMYNLTVYDKRYTSPANGTACSHNSSSESPGWHQHVLTKVVSPVIILIIIIIAVLVFVFRQKLHPAHVCNKSDNTPRKDDKEGSFWKINDIYNT